MAPHSSTLAWKIPWTEEPGGDGYLLSALGSLSESSLPWSLERCGLSLAAVSGSYSLAVVHGLLTVPASPAAERRL